MENYGEQTLSRRRSAGRRVLSALAWAALALLALPALFSGANILGQSADGAMRIDWLSLLMCALCLAGMALIWRLKDKLNVEYDYVLRDGRLEVTEVLNNRRRRARLRLELGKIQECGRGAAARPGWRMERYCLDAVEITYICYEKNGERRMALLALNEDMIAQLRGDGKLPRGVWRGEEGKREANAGLS